MSIEIVFSSNCFLGMGTTFVWTEKYIRRDRKRLVVTGYLVAFKVFPQCESPQMIVAVRELALVGSIMPFSVFARITN